MEAARYQTFRSVSDVHVLIRNQASFAGLRLRTRKKSLVMRKLIVPLITFSFGLVGTTASAASPTGGATPGAPPQAVLKRAQYDLCDNWRRQCANLYGGGSQQWEQCMGQPGAIRDCRGGPGRPGDEQDGGHGKGGDQEGDYREPGNLCANWEKKCADLYGSGSQEWAQCMHQPDAVKDCSGDSGRNDDNNRRGDDNRRGEFRPIRRS